VELTFKFEPVENTDRYTLEKLDVRYYRLYCWLALSAVALAKAGFPLQSGLEIKEGAS
jgi:hypothetical protein